MARSLLEISGDNPADRRAREEHFAIVRQEADDFRKTTNKNDQWLKLWRLFRNVKDQDTDYRNKLVPTYLWSAIMALAAVIIPAFFRAFPAYDLRTPRLEDDEDNRLWEELLTQQVQFASNLRPALMQLVIESLLFGASFPWTNWRTIYKKMPMTRPVVEGGIPALDERGFPRTERIYQDIRTYHAPNVTAVDLWDSFIHPDGRRGFSLREPTGYELWQASEGENSLYDRGRVSLMLTAAQRRIDKDKNPQGSTIPMALDFALGDDTLRDRDELAKEAGTLSGDRLDGYVRGLVKDAMAQKFPILHYDDSDFTGTYALNKDGRLLELKFSIGSCPDGGSHRMSVRPFMDLGEKTIYGVSIAELALEHLLVHSKFTQLAVDAAELTCHPQWLASEVFETWGGEVLTAPGAVNVVPAMAGEDLERHLKPQILPQGFQHALTYREQVERDLDALWAMDEFSRGRISQGRRPATEFKLASQFAAARLGLIMSRFTDDLAVPMGRKWLCMSSIHMSQQDLVDVLGQKALGKRLPSPEQVLRTMQVIFRGSVTAANQDLMLQRYSQMAPSYQAMRPLLHLPDVNAFIRSWMEAAEMEHISKQLPPVNPELGTFAEQQLIMGLASGQGQGQGTPEKPSSPTDIVGAMRAQGGATAPRPPVNTNPGGGGG